ncbi:hypothetical protein FXN63_20880 [Pigmentiphaga aceris]|uniref:Uncharacterized protein n=1 Tax=Pigmentiphaga aceris TaxID=1940612 RepID=A0A5C0B438_9BURK|nr:hypothetical protein [Pigmentiphaga aceris]QEI08020.1 hypothetical protein FXN63_20880 [Pigmentiphaga aceris]
MEIQEEQKAEQLLVAAFLLKTDLTPSASATNFQHASPAARPTIKLKAPEACRQHNRHLSGFRLPSIEDQTPGVEPRQI